MVINFGGYVGSPSQGRVGKKNVDIGIDGDFIRQLLKERRYSFVTNARTKVGVEYLLEYVEV